MANDLAELRTALRSRYTLEREIGRGGMATVWLARDLKHERAVAIKVLRPDVASTLTAERFLREIAIAARLTHPHIVPVFDSGKAGGFLYYVMPYVHGESLRQRLQRERQLALPPALAIARAGADALDFRPPPRGGPSRHQARKHPARGRPRRGSGLRGGAGDRGGRAGRVADRRGLGD